MCQNFRKDSQKVTMGSSSITRNRKSEVLKIRENLEKESSINIRRLFKVVEGMGWVRDHLK
jgi:hypothetical protein